MGAATVAIALMASACVDSGGYGDSSTVTTLAAPTVSSSTTTLPSVTKAPEPTDVFVAPPPATTATPPELLKQLGPYADLILRGGAVLNGSPEHLNYLVSCVESGGFAVELDLLAGSIKANPGYDQMERFRKVLGTCEEAAFESGLVARYSEQTPEELELWYEAFLIAQECLEERGYPTSDPPSLDVYVESGGAAWHPYDALSPTAIAEVEPICPQDLVLLVGELAERGR